MLREVHLGGALGKEFGRTHRLAVETPAEAVRALMSQFPRFRQAVAAGTWRVVRGAERQVRRGERIGEDGLRLRLGACQHLHILPAASGRGGKGGSIGKIVIGVVMVVAAIYTGGAAAAAYSASAGAAATTGGAIAAGMSATVIPGIMSAGTMGMMGLAMIMGGVSQLLSPQKKLSGSDAEKRDSFILAGPTNSGVQGVPVPLVYGRVRVGSVVAAGIIRNESLQNGTPPPETDQTGMLAYWRQALGV